MSKKKKRKVASPGKQPTRLPLLLALVGLLLVAAGMFALRRDEAVPVDEPGDPRLVVDRQSIDFGDVRLGEWVTASFTLSNVGTSPVRFSQTPFIEVVAGC